MAVVIPETVRQAMDAKKIKNLRQLAIACGYGHSPLSIHRMFSGKCQHRSFTAYKRVASALQWTLEQFFFIAAANEPQAVGAFIRARLKQIKKSTYEFTKELSGTTTSNGGWHDYISGNIKYDRLRIYSSIGTTLGITLDTLYESLLIENRLTGQVETYKFESVECNKS